MTHLEFNKLLERRIDLTRKVLNQKSNEYASDGDKLHNFKKAALFLPNGTSSVALWGMLVKHLVSVSDSIDRIQREYNAPSREWCDEKIGNCINYFILLEAVFSDMQAY